MGKLHRGPGDNGHRSNEVCDDESDTFAYIKDAIDYLNSDDRKRLDKEASKYKGELIMNLRYYIDKADKVCKKHGWESSEGERGRTRRREYINWGSLIKH